MSDYVICASLDKLIQPTLFAKRQNNHLLIERIDSLRASFSYVKNRRPLHINAVVIMPDHLHCIWTLPSDDADFSTRWNLLKGHFSRAIDKGECVSKSRDKRRERGLWQRRFWAHLIVDQADFNNHVNYIHWNPVKHDWVQHMPIGVIQVFISLLNWVFIQITGDIRGSLLLMVANNSNDALRSSAHPM